MQGMQRLVEREVKTDTWMVKRQNAVGEKHFEKHQGENSDNNKGSMNKWIELNQTE